MRQAAHEASARWKDRSVLRPAFCLVLCGLISVLYLGSGQWPRTQPRFQELYGENEPECNQTCPKPNLSPSSPDQPVPTPGGGDYVIRTPGCSIPEFDPFDRLHRHVFHRVDRPSCSSTPPVTAVRQATAGADAPPELVLDVDAVRKRHGAAKNYECCYQEIRRHPEKRDQTYTKSKCYAMKTVTPLSNATEFIIVTCKNPKMRHKKEKIWYKNAHALIPDKADVQERLAKFRTAQVTPPVSVLLIGIDSISRLNFIRSMTRTNRHLHDHGWLELRGYNKMADNTYPNLMAILTGYNSTDAYGLCAPVTKHGLDKCPFIWRNFSGKGYVTAYAEDWPNINTFNYRKSGFYNQPTDYYARPLFLAMQSYMPNYGRAGKFCTGPVSAGQRIYDYAIDFTSKYRDDPFFGLLWMNSFSHDDVNLPTTMDGVTMSFLDRLQEIGVLDSSVVFFFSDHGIRFGKSRELHTGFYEERLPFFFAWFPHWFRERYPDLVQNFTDNAERLTTPYDFHMTLRHLLSLSDPEAVAEQRAEQGPPGCPQSDSLLRPVSPDRTCADACIDPHWCTCGKMTVENTAAPQIKEMAQAAVDHLNNVLLAKQPLCSHLGLHKILMARTMDKQHELVFETTPGNAKFEATIVKSSGGKAYKVQKEISRLNLYDGQSNCVETDVHKKYCYCIKQ